MGLFVAIARQRGAIVCQPQRHTSARDRHRKAFIEGGVTSDIEPLVAELVKNDIDQMDVVATQDGVQQRVVQPA